MLIAGDLGHVSYQFVRVGLLLVPSRIETRVRQSQEFLVAGPHEVHERFFFWSDSSTSGAPMFSECDVETEVVDQNEPRIQRDHFCQLVFSESFCPR